MRLVPPVAPIVSLVLLLPASAGGKKSDWFSSDDRMLYLTSFLFFFKPLLPLYKGLFPRWIRQINPIDLGNVPSGTSGYVFPKLSPNVGPPPPTYFITFPHHPRPIHSPPPLNELPLPLLSAMQPPRPLRLAVPPNPPAFNLFTVSLRLSLLCQSLITAAVAQWLPSQKCVSRRGGGGDQTL